MSVGKRLKQARKAQGLSIDDIKNKSKIKKSYLEALENDNYKKLPGEVYTKVYIRGYAKIVGLEPQELLAEYENEKNADRKIEEKHKEKDSESKKSSILNHDSILKVILGIILTLIILLLGYNMFVRTDQNQNNASIDNSQTQIVQNDSANENTTDNGQEQTNDSSKTATDNQSDTQSTESKDKTQNETASNEENNNENINQQTENTNTETNETETEQNNNDSTEENGSSNSDENTNKQNQEPLIEETTKELTIIAKEKSWLQVIVDGELKFQGFIKEDETMTHNGNENIRLKIGNGIAVQVEYEGELLGPFGKRGEVIIKQFEIDN